MAKNTLSPDAATDNPTLSARLLRVEGAVFAIEAFARTLSSSAPGETKLEAIDVGYTLSALAENTQRHIDDLAAAMVQ